MNNLEKQSVSRINRISWILILFEETLLVITGIVFWSSVFEYACIYNWITPWINVLMD